MRHAALLAFRDRVLELQIDRIATDVTLGDPVLVDDAALATRHGLFMRMVRHDLRAAVGTGHPQELESLQITALTFPITNRVLHEVQRAGLAEVREGEDVREHGLQTTILPLFRQKVLL